METATVTYRAVAHTAIPLHAGSATLQRYVSSWPHTTLSEAFNHASRMNDLEREKGNADTCVWTVEAIVTVTEGE
jgi:hypothetical protein